MSEIINSLKSKLTIITTKKFLKNYTTEKVSKKGGNPEHSSSIKTLLDGGNVLKRYIVFETLGATPTSRGSTRTPLSLTIPKGGGGEIQI